LDHDFIAGQCLWTGIDYLGETHGWPEHGSHAGLLTTAAFEKADYYLRQSWWTTRPMIKIATCKADAGKWIGFRHLTLDYAQSEVFTAEVYSNLEDVELFQGDVSLGRKQGRDENGRFTWQVTQNEQPLRAVGYGTSDTGDIFTVQDELYPCGAPASLLVKMWDEELVADGKSVAQLEIRVLDDDGRVINTNQDMIEVSVEGEAKLLHMDNGDLGDITPYGESKRKACGGCLMAYVQSTRYAGDVEVKVKLMTGTSEISNTISLRTTAK
ncbi:MAG: DUF4982 domain-containing protein, partial [Lachnospiraceae bacterium]|nr:DUF4982 domain-containing protein [Lachnospiraceae bacterium]